MPLTIRKITTDTYWDCSRRLTNAQSINAFFIIMPIIILLLNFSFINSNYIFTILLYLIPACALIRHIYLKYIEYYKLPYINSTLLLNSSDLTKEICDKILTY